MLYEVITRLARFHVEKASVGQFDSAHAVCPSVAWLGAELLQRATPLLGIQPLLLRGGAGPRRDAPAGHPRGGSYNFV